MNFTHALLAPCLGAAGYLLSAATAFTQAPVPEELLVRRCQPAVFMALACGDGDVTFPKSVTVKRAALEAQYPILHTPGEEPAAFYWRMVSETPGIYLAPSVDHDSRHFTDEPYATGTAFAISREGILLTNAHVVADPSTATLTGIVARLNLLQAPFSRLIGELAASLGHPPSQQAAQRAAKEIADWYTAQCSVTGKFGHAKIALKFGTNQEKLKSFLSSSNRFSDLSAGLAAAKPEPILRTTKLIAVGEPFPGKDVAVLQIVMDENDKLPAVTLGQQPNGPEASRSGKQSDRLICLPLGDSDAVLPGAAIHALGFPGKAFDPSVMDPEAEFRVSSRTGEIGQTKRTLGNWDAFEMNAEVNHGDSGGPVIDSHGNVIGLTVWGDFPGHKLAVPINVAKEFLKRAGITPDPGPLLGLWEEGLRLFGEGKYAEAGAKFGEVRDRQGGVTRTRFAPIGPVFNAFVSPYVDEMWLRCIKSQKPK